MESFDNFLQVDNNGKIIYNKWIEWDHVLTPNKPEWFRIIMRAILALLFHCLECSALDGCYFVEKNMPTFELHENCDCKKKDITFFNVKKLARADCDIRKFTEYVFKNLKDSKGKNKIFYDLGFDINDSHYLRNEFCKQGLKNYLIGNYTLKNLDLRGQRISIPIQLNGVNFYSGWMLYPEGKIKNTTPFGGWIK